MDKWFLELTVGYSILFLGYGCKDEIITSFSNYLMNQHGMTICTLSDQPDKGSISFVDFLDRIIILVFKLPKPPRKHRKAVMDRCKQIIKLSIDNGKKFCIVINNLNGKTIQRYQDELVLLAKCPNIYFISTVDTNIANSIDGYNFVTHNISTGLEYIFQPNGLMIDWVHSMQPISLSSEMNHADVLILENLLRDNLDVDDYCYKVFVTYGLFKWMGINAICDCKTPREIYIRLRYLYLVEGICAPLILTIPGVLDFVLFCAELMNGDRIKYVLSNGFNSHKKDFLFKKVGFCTPKTRLIIVGKAIEYGVWTQAYEPITNLSVAKLILYSINECQFNGQPIDKTSVLVNRFNATQQSAVIQTLRRTDEEDDEYEILTDVMKNNLDHAKIIFTYLRMAEQPNMKHLFQYHACMFGPGEDKNDKCKMFNSIFKRVGLFKEETEGRLKRMCRWSCDDDDDNEENNDAEAITYLLSISS